MTESTLVSSDPSGTKRPASPSEGLVNPKKRRRSRWGSIDSTFKPVVSEQEKNKPVSLPAGNNVSHDEQKKVSSGNGLTLMKEGRWGAPRTGQGSGRVDFQAIPVAPVSTLKINVNKARERRLRQVMRIKEEDLLETNPEKNPYFDASLSVKLEPKRKLKKDFAFVPEGTFIAKAEKQRLRAESEALAIEMRQKLVARSEAAASVPVLPPFFDERPLKGASKDLPRVEWWDAPFLEDGKYDTAWTDELSVRLNESKITSYIHHPVRVKPSKKEKKAPPIPLMLTAKERKRLRHQRRMDKVREQQEMIQMGVIAPPPPKVKLSNMMRVLANESSADPTKVEKEVRAQMEKRYNDHMARNEAQKQSKEQKHIKAAEKAESDRQAGLQVVVFRILDVSNPQHRFKIEKNAKQLELTGAFVMFENCNVVVVEGGGKAIRKYKRLMLHRIDWAAKGPDSEDDGESEETVQGTKNSDCMTVWEGAVTQSSFDGFKTAMIPTLDGCRSFFRRRKLQHYWDLAINFPTGDVSLGQRSNKRN